MSELIPRAEIIAVPFLDGHIPAVMVDGEPHVVLKPIVDLLGINWASQYAKLSAAQWACIVLVATQLPGEAQARQAVAVTLETFAIWLAGIQEGRVAEEARQTVIAYKREAGRALRDHFFGAPAQEVRKTGDDLDLIEGMVAAIREDRRRLAALEAGQRELVARVEASEGRNDWFTALGYAKLHDRPTNRPHLAKAGRRATQIMRARGEQPHRRQDATFGTVNVYPSDVLEQAFAEI